MSKSTCFTRKISFTVFLIFTCLTIGTSITLLVSLHQKQYLHFEDYWKRLLVESLGAACFLGAYLFILGSEVFDNSKENGSSYEDHFYPTITQIITITVLAFAKVR